MITSNVNFNLYKSFIAVYDARNISRAAANLQITQPTVTYNIKELERQLGTKLFHTHPRGVEPTFDANELYKHVMRGIIAISNGENAIRDFNEQTIYTIRISAHREITSTKLAQAIAKFNAKYSNIRFEISGAGDGSIAKLMQHSTDVVINTTGSHETQIGNIQLKAMKRVVVLSKELAKKSGISNKITAEQFEALPLIIFKNGCKDLEGKKSGKVFTIVNSGDTAIRLVEQGLGAGIFFEEHLEGKNMNDLVMVPFPAELGWKEHDLICAYNKDSITKPARSFVEMICEVYGVDAPFINNVVVEAK